LLDWAIAYKKHQHATIIRNAIAQQAARE
jgi:hypothetical protein